MFNYKKILKTSNLKKHHHPYIIAEAGVNHECSIAKAIQMIKKAKKGGANAIKFQAYKAELIASKVSPAYWDTKKEKSKNQYELFKKYDSFTFKDYKILKKECNKNKIDFMCTPFDLKSADYLNKLVDVFKISSSDITNFPLIEKVSGYKKPIIISTGASSFEEIKEACKLIEKKGNKRIILMHCVLNYPTKNQNSFLGLIPRLKNIFPNYVIGYSDHTDTNFVENIHTAWLLGSQVIEKHFTLNKRLKGNDHYHSSDYKDLKILNKKIKSTLITLNGNIDSKLKIEKKSRINARRSIYTANEIRKNSIIKKSDIICKRPAVGLHPKFYKKIIGKKIKKYKKEDEVIKLTDF